MSEAQFEAALCCLLPHAGCYSCRYVLQSYSHELVVEKEEDTWKFSPLTRMKPKKKVGDRPLAKLFGAKCLNVQCLNSILEI